MAANITCRCGWSGTIDPAPAGRYVRCPACGQDTATTEQTTAGAIEAAQPASGLPPVATLPVSPAWRKTIAEATALLGRGRRAVFGYVRAAFRYYRDHWSTIRDGARLWLIDFFPTLQDPELLRREIRRPLGEDDDIRTIDGVWQIRLPDRCVVCASEAPGDWLEEQRLVLDPYGLIVAPIVGAIAGTVLGGWYHSLLLLVLLPFFGVLVGFALRREVHFLLRLKRCAKHSGALHVPELAVVHGQMVLRPGTREVKLAFLREPSEYQHVIPQPAPASSDEAPLPETIVLADEVHESSSIIFERADARLPAADQQNDSDDGTQPLV